jgi:hypothetical protein
MRCCCSGGETGRPAMLCCGVSHHSSTPPQSSFTWQRRRGRKATRASLPGGGERERERRRSSRQKRGRESSKKKEGEREQRATPATHIFGLITRAVARPIPPARGDPPDLRRPACSGLFSLIRAALSLHAPPGVVSIHGRRPHATRLRGRFDPGLNFFFPADQTFE